ncbi:uncharacterized protein KGF55_001371 [Candida pseudojiufengensis]|uniref:uncharacterized protein n=1 Tax=Candida pseudojiufengensis TaxID=497109 RepID=UPI002224B2CD|nr:uncharacterized protein KGF55_001371 [Candida pseudojiufengensis]KAI5965151.1 hypothetical protein KGF55_001371 [Candida pseudojiufengensis]
MKIEELPDEYTNSSNDINKCFEKLKDLNHSSQYYHPYLLDLNNSTIILNLQQIQILSLHSNPNLSWSSLENSQLVQAIISKNNITHLLPQYINNYFRPKLQEIEKLVKLSSKLQQSSLRPRLTFQDNKFDSIPLAQAWFLITFQNDSEIQLLSLLLIIDTLKFDIDTKIQACKLLEYLQSKEIKLTPSIKNLINPLRTNLGKCLTHVPPITPDNESLNLLSIVYPCLYELDKKFGSNLNFIEIISQILTSLNYVHNYPNLMIFLLNQLSIVIKQIKLDVLISISKIFYTLNNIITNLNYLEQYPQIIKAALNVENDMLTSIDNPIIYSFVYDLIGAYGILLKRVSKYEINGFKDIIISQNLKSLQELASKYDKLNEFNDLCTYIQQ